MERTYCLQFPYQVAVEILINKKLNMTICATRGSSKTFCNSPDIPGNDSENRTSQQVCVLPKNYHKNIL